MTPSNPKHSPVRTKGKPVQAKQKAQLASAPARYWAGHARVRNVEFQAHLTFIAANILALESIQKPQHPLRACHNSENMKY
jgi:hypothetical protein